MSEPSASRLKRPEYWQKWLNETLESSAEAKRTNRNFRSSLEGFTETTVRAPQRTSGKVGAPDNAVSETAEEKSCPMARDSRVNLTVESLVCENIALPLETEDIVATATEVQPCHLPFGRRNFRKEMFRSVAHEAVYQILKVMKSVRPRKTVCP